MTTQVFRVSETYEQALDRAARLWGIEPEYGDTWGKRHVTSPEIKRAILTALGVPAGSREELDRAVEERLWAEWDRVVPPVAVLGQNSWSRGFPIHAPAEMAGEHAVIEIQWEGCPAEHQEVPLAHLKSSGAAELRGTHFLRKQFAVPAHSPFGYHDVTVAIGGRSATMRLILCPDRAWEPPALAAGHRAAGVAIALYGLRSSRNWGCGDFTDLKEFIDWASSEVGAGFIGLNPLHAIANRQPYNISPYLPSSTFYKNPIYLDLERIEDFRNSARAQAFFGRNEIQDELARLRSSELVEYERVWKLKLRALKLAFVHFLRELRAGSERATAFREYVEREGDLLDRFATWCALDEHLHARRPDVWIWTEWPEEYRDPDSTATRNFATRHWRLVLFYKYAQWLVDEQLEAAQKHARERGLPIGLYHDLALATDQFGADLWACRRFYVSGCRVGAPPDGFSPHGQDWAFPPPNSEHHRETGYRLFTETIRQNCRHGGALRIDHVMRFFRLYWIPQGMDPAHGAYVRDNHADLLHILALESIRQKVVIIGEDLGTVTTEIRQALGRFGLLGYKVPYFEKNDRGDFRMPSEYTVRALVSSSTHDLPTLAGFWLGRDLQARKDCGLLRNEESCYHGWSDRAREKQKLLDCLFALHLLPQWFPRRVEHLPEFSGELHNALVGWIAAAPSQLMILNQEDLTKDTEQQNLPATTDQYPNWRHKMRFSLEELATDSLARDFTSMVRGWLEQTGRLCTSEPAART